MNLIEAWLAAETAIPSRTAADALRDLNAVLGTNHSHSNLSKWRRGAVTPAPKVLRYMAQRSAHQSIEDALGIDATPHQVGALVERMTP